jgi:hypothetical protein
MESHHTDLVGLFLVLDTSSCKPLPWRQQASSEHQARHSKT